MTQDNQPKELDFNKVLDLFGESGKQLLTMMRNNPDRKFPGYSNLSGQDRTKTLNNLTNEETK